MELGTSVRTTRRNQFMMGVARSLRKSCNTHRAHFKSEFPATPKSYLGVGGVRNVGFTCPEMNDYHSNMETSYLPRAAAPLLEGLLRVFPVTVVMGARQVGKSTLVRHHPALQGHLYLTLDDLDLRLQAEEAPEALLQRGERLVLDEVQRTPELLLALKRAVDQDRTPGRYVLTGSANILLLARLSETLAGRAVYLHLWPMTRRERLGLGQTGPWGELLYRPFSEWPEVLKEQKGPQEDWREAVARGGFPIPASLPHWEERTLWFRGYLQTYLERDVPALRAVEHLPELRRLLQALAFRTGSLLNQSELARDLGLSQPTVHRYLNLLEVSFLLVRLPGYARSRTKRLVKAPKPYLPDPALALFMTGGEPSGAHLETLVLLDLLVFRDTQPDPPGLYYWRTASGQEVDFVLEGRERLLPVEVKATPRPIPKDARGLEAFLEEYPEAEGGLLLHGGEGIFPLVPRVLAAPWWAVI